MNSESQQMVDFIAKNRAKSAELHRKTVLSDVVIQEIKNFLRDYLHLEATKEVILDIIPPGSPTYAMICEFGVAQDTATRDEIADCFSLKLVGRRFPQYGEFFTEVQREQFFKELAKAAEDANIKIAKK